MTTFRELNIEYTDKAFLDDAKNAMKGDLARGIVELVTNSDDAYHRTGVSRGQKGKIQIVIQRSPKSDKYVKVFDMAGGMTESEMEEGLTRLGGRHSGFAEGEKVRGNKGRGAKDIIGLGNVEFESIKDGQYTKLEWLAGQRPKISSEKALDHHRKAMSLRGNKSGTVVTLYPEKNNRTNKPIRPIPLHEKLLERLTNTLQLRDINSDPQRELRLVSLPNGKSHLIRYKFPEFPIQHEESLDIPGYPDARAYLTIKRNTEADTKSKNDDTRIAGLLIRSTRAIHESTLFGHENRPSALVFSGEVHCEYIDYLQKDYDDRIESHQQLEENNPEPIITRTRDGLNPSHPFYLALSSAVEPVLEPFIVAEEQASTSDSSLESPDLKKKFRALSKQLGRVLTGDLEELDIDPDWGGTGEGIDKQPDLRIAPGDIVLYLGEEKTMSVIAKKSLGETMVEITDVEPEGIVDFGSNLFVPLKQHKRVDELQSAQVVLSAIQPNAEALITVKCGTYEESALIVTRDERDDTFEAPETLVFDRDSYRMKVGNKRNVHVQAPVELVDQYGGQVKVESNHSEIVVLGGGKADLKFDEEYAMYETVIGVDPRQLGATGKLTATLGDEKAECNIAVKEDLSGPDMEIHIVDRAQGAHRYELATDRYSISIMGQHHAIKRYLDDSSRASVQTSPKEARIVIAEIVSDAVVDIYMRSKYPIGETLRTFRTPDIEEYFHDRRQFKDKYLKICHRTLVPEN